MATAIEYGLVAALAAVVGIAAVGGLNGPNTPPQILRTIKETSHEGAVIMEDVESKCRYVVINTGITIRYRSNGTIDCPKVSQR